MTDAATAPSRTDVGPRPPFPAARHLPNALTVARLVLACAFFVLLALWSPATRDLPDALLIASGALFVVAAITDALDGYFARKWRVISRFGRIMDPFADKVLVAGAFIMLAGSNFNTPTSPDASLQLSGVLPWMVVVILARELLVTSIRGLLESEGIDCSAGPAGKAKMVLQSVVVPLILVLLAFDPCPPGSAARWTIDLAVWLTVGVTVLSGWPYVRKAVTALPRA